MSVKTVFIRTASDGSYTYQREFKAVIYGIEVIKGDLSTPDIDITDDTYSKTFLSVDGVAADTMYVPGALLQTAAAASLDTSDESGVIVTSGTPAVCMGVLKIVVTGAGSVKKGRINILYQS